MTGAVSRTRPRDRRERIVAAAARRFHRSGYHQVTSAAVDRGERPELPYADAELLAWAVYAVLTSIAYHRTRPERDRLTALIRRMAGAVCAVRPPGAGLAYAAPEAPPVPATRRETLATEAGRLFDERGYPAVTMEEIGAAAGRAEPRPARDHRRPACGDHRRVRHVRRVRPGVPAPARRAVHRGAARARAARRAGVRAQRAYADAWTALLTARGTDVAKARVRTHAALTIANDLVRMRRVRARPAAGAAVHALMPSVLDPPHGD